ncbi:MAG: FG-GAP repeat domain-containing protein, partial [Planctomycetota bacterium]
VRAALRREADGTVPRSPRPRKRPASAGDSPTVRSYRADRRLRLSELRRVEVPAPGEIHLADVTGDGKLDAVLHRAIPGKVGVQLSVLEGDGMGGFRLLAGTVAVADSAGSYNRDTSGHALFRDLDGDGHRDIVLSVPIATIFWGPSFSGFRFVGEAESSRGGIASLDADGDGREDLVFADVYGLVLGIQKSSRLFRAVRADVGADGPVFAEDLDGDGKKEVLCAAADSVQAFAVDRGRLALVPGGVLAPFPYQYKDFELADLDGDGIPDLVSLHYFSYLEVRFGSRYAAGYRLSDLPLEVPIPGVAPMDFKAVRDANGDGVADLLVGRACVLGAGARSFEAPLRMRGSEEVTAIAAADIDGDGYLDLLSSTASSLDLVRGGREGFEPP